MESEGPYFHKCGTIGEASNCKACAYEEGRKSMDKELEQMKANVEVLKKDFGFVIDEREKDFRELLGLANRMWDILDTEFSYVAKGFDVWKKARGIE